MKKLLLILALAGVSLAGTAQEEPILKHSVATNSFWSNWYVQGNFAYSAFYSSEEKHDSPRILSRASVMVLDSQPLLVSGSLPKSVLVLSSTVSMAVL